MQPIHRFAPQKLLVIGASARAATQSARRAGLRPIAMDLFGDCDTRSSAEGFVDLRHGIVETCGSGEIDPLGEICDPAIPAMLVGDCAASGNLMPRLKRKRIGAQPAQQLQMARPEFLRQIARRSGVQFPSTVKAKPKHHDGWLRKTNLSGGLGVSWDKDSHPEFSVLLPTNNNTVWQQWMPGQAYGASFFGDGRQSSLLGVCRSRFTRCGIRPFVYAGSTTTTPRSKKVIEQLTTLGECVVDQTNLTGLFNIDVLVWKESVCLLEINPRWSSSMELLDRLVQHAQLGPLSLIGDAFRFEMHGCAVEDLSAIEHLKASVSDECQWLCDKRIVYSRRSGTIDQSELLDVAGDEFTIADIPADAATIGANEPIATLLSVFDRTERNVDRWLRARRASIRAIQSAVKPSTNFESDPKS